MSRALALPDLICAFRDFLVEPVVWDKAQAGARTGIQLVLLIPGAFSFSHGIIR